MFGSFREMAEEKPKISNVWNIVKLFFNGGAFGMVATCVIHLVDMIKVRIQLGQGSGYNAAKNMLRDEGFGVFLQGVIS